jgi:hypothetical protein
MPFELGVEPLVVSERWSWGCLVGACATAHRSSSGVAVRPEELNKFLSIACLKY